MKRKYKKALQDCFEPPAPQRKAQFLQQIQAEQSQDTATPLLSTGVTTRSEERRVGN